MEGRRMIAGERGGMGRREGAGVVAHIYTIV